MASRVYRPYLYDARSSALSIDDTTRYYCPLRELNGLFPIDSPETCFSKEFSAVMVLHLPISFYPGRDSGFGDVHRDDCSVKTTQLVLWTIQMCHAAKAPVYFETLHSTTGDVIGNRLWCVLSANQLIRYCGVVSEFFQYEESQIAEERAESKRRCLPSPHPLSYKWIRKPEDWIDRWKHSGVGASVSYTFSTLSHDIAEKTSSDGNAHQRQNTAGDEYDDDDVEFANSDNDLDIRGGAVDEGNETMIAFSDEHMEITLSENSTPSLLSAKVYFDSEGMPMRVLHSLDADPRTMQMSNYFTGRHMFTVPRDLAENFVVYSAEDPWKDIVYQDGGSDAFLLCKLPHVQPSDWEIAGKIISLERGMGRADVYRDYENMDRYLLVKCLSNLGRTDGRYTTDNGSDIRSINMGSDMSQFSPIQVERDIYSGLSESDEIMKIKYPVIFAEKNSVKKEYYDLCKLIRRREVDKQGAQYCVRHIQKKNVYIIRRCEQLDRQVDPRGIPRYLTLLGAERNSMDRDMKSGENRMLARHFYMADVRYIDYNDGSNTFGCAMLVQLCEIFGMCLELMAVQVALSLISWIFCITMVENKFGPQPRVYALGDSDTGKSHAMMTTGDCLPAVLYEQMDAESNKAWTLDQELKFRVKDESGAVMNGYNGKDNSPVAKRNQTVTNMGILSYISFKRVPDGEDIREVRRADHRGINGYCSNDNTINDAEKSRRTTLSFYNRSSKKGKTKPRAGVLSPKDTIIHRSAKGAMRRIYHSAFQFWQYEAVGSIQHIEKGNVEIFMCLIDKCLVERGLMKSPPNRFRLDVQKMATGICILRLTGRAERIGFPVVAKEGHSPTSLLYYQSRAVILMEDVVSAWCLLRRATSMDDLHQKMLSALKDCICFNRNNIPSIVDGYYLLGHNRHGVIGYLQGVLSGVGHGLIGHMLDEIFFETYADMPVAKEIQLNGGPRMCLNATYFNQIHIRSRDQKLCSNFLADIMDLSDSLKNNTALYHRGYTNECELYFNGIVREALEKPKSILLREDPREMRDYGDGDNIPVQNVDPSKMIVGLDGRDMPATSLFRKVARIIKPLHDVGWFNYERALYFDSRVVVDGINGKLVRGNGEVSPNEMVCVIDDESIVECTHPKYVGKFKTGVVHRDSVVYREELIVRDVNILEGDMGEEEECVIQTAMAASGEIPDAERNKMYIFAGVDMCADPKANPAVRILLDYSKAKTVDIDNPRYMGEASTITLDDDSYRGTFMDKNKKTLRIGPGSNISHKLIDETSVINTGAVCSEPFCLHKAEDKQRIVAFAKRRWDKMFTAESGVQDQRTEEAPRPSGRDLGFSDKGKNPVT